MFCTRVAWVCLVCLLLCKEELRLFAITEGRDRGIYEVPLSMSLLGSTMLISLLPYVWYLFQHMLVKNASPRGPMCIRCLMFSLSGPCELLF